MSKQVEGPTFEQDMQELQETLNRKKLSTKIKSHFKRHKEAYIVGGIGVTVGVGVGYFLHSRLGMEGGMSNVVDALSPKQSILVNSNNNNVVNNVVKNIGRNGHPGKVIYCNENKKVYRSLREAGKLLKISPKRISEAVNQGTPVNGLTFEYLGDAVESELDAS